MHNTLLVNKIDTEGDLEKKVEVFFQIGEMEQVRDKLMDFFNNPDSHLYERCLYRYNGIILKIRVRDIPLVVASLMELKIKLYSVYEPYKPI